MFNTMIILTTGCILNFSNVTDEIKFDDSAYNSLANEKVIIKQEIQKQNKEITQGLIIKKNDYKKKLMNS